MNSDALLLRDSFPSAPMNPARGESSTAAGGDSRGHRCRAGRAFGGRSCVRAAQQPACATSPGAAERLPAERGRRASARRLDRPGVRGVPSATRSVRRAHRTVAARSESARSRCQSEPPGLRVAGSAAMAAAGVRPLRTRVSYPSTNVGQRRHRRHGLPREPAAAVHRGAPADCDSVSGRASPSRTVSVIYRPDGVRGPDRARDRGSNHAHHRRDNVAATQRQRRCGPHIPVCHPERPPSPASSQSARCPGRRRLLESPADGPIESGEAFVERSFADTHRTSGCRSVTGRLWVPPRTPCTGTGSEWCHGWCGRGSCLAEAVDCADDLLLGVGCSRSVGSAGHSYI